MEMDLIYETSLNEGESMNYEFASECHNPPGGGKSPS